MKELLVFETDAEVYTWGNGSRGRLGRSESQNNVPKKISFDEEEPFVVTSIVCSHGSTLVATKSKCDTLALTVYLQFYTKWTDFFFFL